MEPDAGPQGAGELIADVMRAIRVILDTDPEAAPSFGAGAYPDAQGQMRPHYLMDRDGFLQLVMGFTGAEAIRWRRTFIAAFNAMEAELRKPAAPVALTREQRIAAALIESQQVVVEGQGRQLEAEYHPL